MQTSREPIKPKVEIIYPELSHAVVGVAYEVHKQLGPGFSEDIYEKAFIHELKTRGISYEEQKVIPIFYKGENLGIYRLDLIVDGKIIVELKAVTQMNDLFKQQVLSYLKATHLQLGILVNFGNQSVEYFRVVNTKDAVKS